MVDDPRDERPERDPAEHAPPRREETPAERKEREFKEKMDKIRKSDPNVYPVFSGCPVDPQP